MVQLTGYGGGIERKSWHLEREVRAATAETPENYSEDAGEAETGSGGSQEFIIERQVVS